MKKLNIKKISIYLSFLLVSMLVFTACSNKDNADGPTIAVSWSTDEVDKDSKDKVDIDTQMYADALRKAGAKVVFLNEMKSCFIQRRTNSYFRRY